MQPLNGEWGWLDKEKGIYKFSSQYVIKQGEDSKKAEENARNAYVIIQMGNKVFQKIDLQTLKSYTVDKTYLREWYDYIYKVSKVSEGLTMKMNQKEVMKTLGKNYQKVSFEECSETGWRYDIKANKDYVFNSSVNLRTSGEPYFS